MGPKRKLLVLLVESLLIAGAATFPVPAVGADAGHSQGRGVILIHDVYELQNMSLDLKGSYELANDIDASATTTWNGGAGFAPVGNGSNSFKGSLDGKNHTISGLFINRPGNSYVGLFGYISIGGSVTGVGLVNGNVTGDYSVGGLAGTDDGRIDNSYYAGNVTGNQSVGGLAGCNDFTSPSTNWVNHSHAAANVTGNQSVGGLIGSGAGTVPVKNSYFTGSVNGNFAVGGIFGADGFEDMGGDMSGAISNTHYDIDDVLINGEHQISIGGIFDAQYQDWFSGGLALDISDYNGSLVPSGGYYDISDVRGLLDMLGFADVAGLTFRLASDIDLANSSGFFIPYLSAAFDGSNHTISNLHLNRTSVSGLGMFGINNAGKIVNVGLLNIEVRGYADVGGLIGMNKGAVNNSYATGKVEGTSDVGGLVGYLSGRGTVNHSCAKVDVTGTGSGIGGLVGFSHGVVAGSHATGQVSGTWGVGGLVGDATVEGQGRGAYKEGTIIDSYATGNVSGHYSVGGLAGISHWSLVNGSYATGNVNGTGVCLGGLVGYLDDSMVSYSYATGNVNGGGQAGGLVGACDCMYSGCMVVNSYATGNVTGNDDIGGLVGCIDRMHLGTNWVNNTYATGNVTGNDDVGGLVGSSDYGMLSNSYSAGHVAGTGNHTGGLMGLAANGTVSSCFWDNLTSGQNTSDGGSGRTTAVMQTQSTFTGAGWDFNDTWRMIENVTYPLFRWHILASPVAEAGSGQTVEEGTVVAFDGSGSTADFGIANYTWSFYDGIPRTVYGVGPTYRFDHPGIYNVTLKVTDVLGSWDIDTTTVTVNDITSPISNAGPDQVVDVGTSMIFDGSASYDYAGIVNYTWTFNDGAGDVVLYGAGPSHRFDLLGIYTVTLNVTDAKGRWGIDAMTVTVKDLTPPTADAGPDLFVDEGTLVTFDGNASLDNFGIVNFSWKFIDGAPVALYGVGPAYRFDNPGVFVVTLTVTDAAANRGVDTMTVTVKESEAPIADAGPDRTVDEGSPVTFDGSASSDNVGVENFTWTFTDGGPVTLYGARPTYRFDRPGIFAVTLTVADAAGNRDADAMTVTVNDITAPVANAGPDRLVDEGSWLTFDGSASSDNVGVVNYTWTFTDGGPVTLYGARPTYKFDNPGVFVVALNVTDAANNRGVDTLTVTVKDISAPFADAGPDLTVDEGTPVTFNGSGSSDNVGVVNYSWAFDYGQGRIILYGVSPSFTFSIPGVYHVLLNVSDAAGLWREDTLTLTVKDITPPVAVAGPDLRIRAGSTVVFDGSLSTDNGAIEMYFWNFTYGGKARSLEGKNASFKFDKPGVYEIVLTVIDGAGNRGEDRVVITVEPSVKTDGGLTGLLWMPVLLIAVLVAMIAGYVIVRKRRAMKGGPLQEDVSSPGTNGRNIG